MCVRYLLCRSLVRQSVLVLFTWVSEGGGTRLWCTLLEIKKTEKVDQECLTFFYSTDFPVVNVLQNTKATLPCPHKKGNVLWKHLIGGPTVIVDTKKGREGITNKRYDFQEDNSLLILNVQVSDSARGVTAI